MTGVEGQGEAGVISLRSAFSWSAERLWAGLPMEKQGKEAYFLLCSADVGVEGQGIMGSLNVRARRGPKN